MGWYHKAQIHGRPVLAFGNIRIPVSVRARYMEVQELVSVLPAKPRQPLSDGPQALLPDQYASLMADLRKLAELLGRTIDR